MIVGYGTQGRPKVIYDHYSTLEIGNYCVISEGVVVILGEGHSYEYISMYPFNQDVKHKKMKGVKIGHGVWIGYGATILPGSEIGNGAVIGAKCVVKGKVPPYAIMIGNPARLLKYRLNRRAQKKVEDMRWWELSEEELKGKDLMVDISQ